ncbi:MAG: DUF1700 domain-containing protein [Ruminococcus sp.]|uniref:DUF1700 domain-containing protein n=1 Tax=Ruminococcus sp. TaxID=41978 RepID=UPI0025EC8F66|nr:DUF1700 domain-containing protein [Ruminococcus sp.]MBR5684291.1 DUF1700 domain-containing protein [Ruminococcus sp.]
MNKLEFLTRLRNSLEKGGLPKEDINDALTYYEEVFLDAGFGKEEETAASMGSPEDVAVNILRESGIHVDPAPVMPPQNTGAQSFNNNAAAQPVKKTSGGTWALRILIGVLTFPIWLPVLIVICSLLFTIIVVVCSLVFAAAVAAIALIIGGLATIFESPFLALMFIGAGLVVTGIVLLICKPAFSSLIPACGRAVKRFWNWIMSLFKKGEKENV